MHDIYTPRAGVAVLPLLVLDGRAFGVGGAW